jgi:hypothetical protein
LVIAALLNLNSNIGTLSGISLRNRGQKFSLGVFASPYVLLFSGMSGG